MLETEIAKLTEALAANTAALNAVLAASAVSQPAKAAQEPAKAAQEPAKAAQEPAKAPKKKAAPAAAPVVEETPAPVVEETPAPVVEETPAPVPHDNEHPEIPEFVDVDAVIAEITEIVKNRILKATPGEAADVKARWTAVREHFKVDRISDLRNNTPALLDALQRAKEL